jgi:hypothetical protein
MSAQARPTPHPPAAAPARRTSVGVWLLVVTGLVLIASGVTALVLAATVNLLPDDVSFLRLNAGDLCRIQGCRVLHFMSHDRVAWGSSMVAVGVLYLWVAGVGVRRGEAWAWWSLIASGLVGFGSFLTYLGYGYLDAYHALASLPLLLIFVTGLVLTWGGLRSPRGAISVMRTAQRPLRFRRAWLGRALLLVVAIGMIAAGATILAVGSVRVFVPQDLTYIGLDADQLRAINSHLVPLIAHDREGFGGGLCATGLTVLAVAWSGLRLPDPGLWWVLVLAGGMGFGGAIGVHVVVGYTSLSHLLPALIGAVLFALSLGLLHGPMRSPRAALGRGG